ncbi:hypothetical protein PHLGIDRAFT_118795 [Phlebiopsis gigantea 11061_1 CR5-6]|uniref:Uncharacterized protein n=1 Tax=Phlebiopsis gigantea (strain 11061_1 CR5-6) TaxID=745531 RepID=A0A0C3RXL6_PHLG1|nr:hypothetical protein PHLGIDRAFT_118795 [Phlebiopsis gigantea 11061_1 CR5-6]
MPNVPANGAPPSSGLSTTSLALAIALPIAFALFVLPWIIRYVYLRVTHQSWSGCLQTADAPRHLRPPRGRFVLDLSVGPTESVGGEEKGVEILPGLKGAAGREVGVQDAEGRYERRDMEVRTPERARVQPPAYRERM